MTFVVIAPCTQHVIVQGLNTKLVTHVLCQVLDDLSSPVSMQIHTKASILCSFSYISCNYNVAHFSNS